jgi:hypothetical protein
VKAGLGLAAAATALAAGLASAPHAAPAAGRPVSAHDGTVTTTYHHPFYDITQAAFVEAQDVHVGDRLQTPGGTAHVSSVRLYHQDATTYDLTIGDLHTYYVEAGDTPVLVHNCTTPNTIEASLPKFGTETDQTIGQVIKFDDPDVRGPDAPATRVGSLKYSGRDPESWRAMNKFLTESPDVPNLPVRNAQYPQVSHVESQWAWTMRNSEITSSDIVINNVPCPGRYTCFQAVGAILPQGSRLTVWFRDPDSGVMQGRPIDGKGPKFVPGE